MQKLTFTIIFITNILTNLIAQEIQQKEIFVDRKSKRILIPYRIIDQSQLIYEYNIRLFYSLDAGDTFRGPVEFADGHVGEQVVPGGQKLIVWHFLNDNQFYNGVRTKFKIIATRKLSVLNLKGPEAALYSVLLPGLGNRKVRFLKKKNNWLYATIPTLVLLGGGVVYKIRSNRTYQNYLASLNRPEADQLFAQANRQNRLGVTGILLGLAVWTADVIQVGIKGMKNKKEIKEIKEKNQEIDMRFQIGFQGESQGLGFGLSLKF
ncbi:MAG: hypothetical protein AAFU64_06830 [Bacteroidota bacterium]